MRPAIGVIADDFTGASDIAGMLARGGMRVRQTVGVPDATTPAPHPDGGGLDAMVVSIKSRSLPAADAVDLSLAALDRLRAEGCRQIYFKYCSTFDSTRDGNIGPVAMALMRALGVARTVFVPALPENGRTVYQGHLFVHDRLLSESGMEHHPLTPMTDPDIRRWLSHQVTGKVGHLGYAIVEQGPDAVRAAFDRSEDPFLVVDTLSTDHLHTLARAFRDLPLVTGGSGLAIGLPGALRETGAFAPHGTGWRPVTAPAVCLAGSCSAATREQVAVHGRSHPVIGMDVPALVAGTIGPGDYLERIMAHIGDLPLLASTTTPDALRAVQEAHGREATAQAIERTFATVATGLWERGVRIFICAGGETSGAIVSALKVEGFDLGPEIDPGVPALRAIGGTGIAMALKSGNFGAPDFFAKAHAILSGGRT